MKYIVANWKMNMNMRSITQWIQDFDIFESKNKIIIAPTNLHIPTFFEFTKSSNIDLAAQDISIYDKGSHTGDLGAFQVKEFCKYCIVGHSERKESMETVLSKRDKCLEENIIPIVCFTQPDQTGRYYEKGVILAWEDPANISKGGVFNEKDPAEIIEGIRHIKSLISEEAVLLYGGSVNNQNIHNLVGINELDGVLIGSASLDSKQFVNIINAYEI